MFPTSSPHRMLLPVLHYWSLTLPIYCLKRNSLLHLNECSHRIVYLSFTVCVCVCTSHVCTCRGQRLSSSISTLACFLRQGLSSNLKFADLLAVKPQESILLYVHCHTQLKQRGGVPRSKIKSIAYKGWHEMTGEARESRVPLLFRWRGTVGVM